MQLEKLIKSVRGEYFPFASLDYTALRAASGAGKCRTAVLDLIGTSITQILRAPTLQWDGGNEAGKNEIKHKKMCCQGGNMAGFRLAVLRILR